jgi:sugar phosphate isomerase/epimerase
VTRKHQFGVSTHLYHNYRLGREHLREVAAHGFERVELFATRTHIDYHNPAAIADLQQWLAEAGLELHGVHAPVGESFSAGRWGPLFNLASADEATRLRAMAEAEHALQIARRIPFGVLVAHLGVPHVSEGARGAADVNRRDAARRSIEALARQAEPLGVRLAVEVIPNELSRPDALVHFVEEVVEAVDEAPVGICLDFGHAHMGGDLVDAIETVSEHVITTHVHDNGGRTDDHFVPFDGTIDWPTALTAIQKIGYDGTLVLEIANRGSTAETLQRARKARERMEGLLD